MSEEEKRDRLKGKETEEQPLADREEPATAQESREADPAAPAADGEPTPEGKGELSASLEGLQAREEPKGTSLGAKLRRIAVAVLIAVLIMAGGAAAFLGIFYQHVSEPQRLLLDEQRVFLEQLPGGAEAAGPSTDEAFSDSIVNIAVLGFDRGWGREMMGEYLFRPDMIAVFSIDFSRDKVSVIRVTRDSYVPMHGMGGRHDKINHSYFYGYYYGGGEDRHADGIKATLETARHVLGGIPLHYYVSVDMYSVVALVDAMGGVYFEVEETIYDKHWEIGRVLVPEGPQVMDGVTYLRYLQYRDDASGQDFGRIERQMDLLTETFFYLREKGRITDIPATYRVYKDYVETDLSYTQITALALYANRLEFNDDNLRIETLPSYGARRDGIWYQLLRQDDRVRIIEEVFGVETEPWPRIVLEDSPEYLAEQERKRREALMGLSSEDDERLPEWQRARGGLFGDEEEEGEVPDPTLSRDTESSPAANSDTESPPEPSRDRDSRPAPAGGEETVQVPDLRAMTEEAARNKLKQAGLTPGSSVKRPYAFLEEGLVINSDPRAGARAAPGTVVNLHLSAGKEEPGSSGNVDNEDDTQ